ncbi:hypothetical protein BT69DRAFT_1282477 [Atractiella rhizophila]|nr:hypothetical protein BT69DRAFT_1282477 [Atractiella rhizophila]
MMRQLLSFLLFLLLHTLYAFSRLISYLSHLLFSSDPNQHFSLDTVDVGTWLKAEKRLRHLAISLDTAPSYRNGRVKERERERAVRTACRAVEWAIEIGVESLALFDPSGVFEHYAEQIAAAVPAARLVTTAERKEKEKEEEAPYTTLQIDHPTFLSLSEPRRRTPRSVSLSKSTSTSTTHSSSSSSSDSTAPSSLPSASSSPTPLLTIHLLSPRASKPYLAQITRSLLSRSPPLDWSDIDIRTIDAEWKLPEPDLLVVLGGESCTLRGFPAWGLRLSEIFHSKRQQELDVTTVKEAMAGFLRSEQRVGK